MEIHILLRRFPMGPIYRRVKWCVLEIFSVPLLHGFHGLHRYGEDFGGVYGVPGDFVQFGEVGVGSLVFVSALWYDV